MPIRHIVLLRFHGDTPEATRAQLLHAFAALGQSVNVVKSLEWGTNVSPEGLHKGFEYCFTLLFADTEGRDAYLVHPHHQDFVANIKPWLADVLVIDYQACEHKPPC